MPAQKSADVGVEAMRREVEAKKQEREAMFAKLRAVPPPPAPKALPVEVMIRNAPPVPIQLLRQAIIEQPARPRDDDDLVDEDPPQREAFVVAGNLDRYFISGMENETVVHDRLNSLLAKRIEQAGRVHQLTAAHREKLRLAGRGDIKHSLDRVEGKRREFGVVKMDLDQFRLFLSELELLRNELLLGPFGAKSLYSKTLEKILTDEGAKPRAK
jgi:hypothetical protein